MLVSAFICIDYVNKGQTWDTWQQWWPYADCMFPSLISISAVVVTKIWIFFFLKHIFVHAGWRLARAAARLRRAGLLPERGGGGAATPRAHGEEEEDPGAAEHDQAAHGPQGVSTVQYSTVGSSSRSQRGTTVMGCYSRRVTTNKWKHFVVEAVGGKKNRSHLSGFDCSTTLRSLLATSRQLMLSHCVVMSTLPLTARLTRNREEKAMDIILTASLQKRSRCHTGCIKKLMTIKHRIISRH